MQNNTQPAPLLQFTGQRSKFAVAGVGFFGGAALCWLAGYLLKREFAMAGVLLLCLALAATLGGCFIALRGIRCPSCRMPWVQAALGRPLGNWLGWLLDLRECPKCHFAGPIDNAPSGVVTNGK